MTQTQNLAVPPNLKPEGFPGIPEGWTAEAETFLSPGTSSDPRVQLFGVHYQNKKSSRPNHVLIVVHGMGEHGGRYQHFPHYFQNNVGHVYVLDHRGHGRSEGVRGHILEFDTLTSDLAYAVERIAARIQERAQSQASAPVALHLFGHSLGGLIALRLLFLHPEINFASSTVSAPALAIKAKVPVIKKLAAEILAHVWGSLQLATELDVTAVSRDVEVQKAYKADRLVHSKMTPKFYKEFMAAMKDTRGRETGIRSPLLMVLPMQDAIIDSEVSLLFFRALKHRDKRLKTFPDFRHESFNEVGKEQAFTEVSQWIEDNCAKAE